MTQTFFTNGSKYVTSIKIYNLLQSVKSSNTAFLMVFTVELEAGNIIKL